MRGVEQVPWLYDLGMSLLEAAGLGPWRRWLTAEAGSGRVLDVGCGTGRNLALLPADTRVVGLEPCADSLRQARRRAPLALLVQARAEALPFRDGAFATITSGLVFCSVRDVPLGLAELRRVLAPGGTLRMLEHVRSLHPWQAWLQDRLQPVWTCLTGGCHPNRETEQAVEAAHFSIEAGTRRAAGSMRRFVAVPAAWKRP